MPKKLKTHQAIAKRIKITKKRKILIKTAGQDHFNAREAGKITCHKRRLKTISKANIRTIKQVVHV